MKRILLIILAACMVFSLSACNERMTFPKDDLDAKWGDASAPTAAPTALPTALPSDMPTDAPATPVPGVTPESVTDLDISLTFDFGDYAGSYTGDIVNGLPNGYGTFISYDDSFGSWSYVGEWKDGHFNGDGVQSFEDGYEEGGYYVDDYLTGEGWESWYGILQYQGGYQDSYYHGEGTLYNFHGEIVYSGAFNNGLLQETAEARASRVGAFKDISSPATAADLYTSCENETSLWAQVNGVIFDVYYFNRDDNPSYCEFLMYESGIEDETHIVNVFYTLSEGEALPTDGQSVTVWGSTEYLYTYNSSSDQELTVPLLEAWSIE